MHHSFIRLAFVASTLLGLAACGRDAGPTDAETASGKGQTLGVYNWSDYIGKDTLSDFEKKTGIHVTYAVYSTNDALQEKLAATPNAYDVVFPTARPYAARMVDAGQLAPLDRKLLPNLKHIDPAILAELATIDPGNAHILPYMWGTTGLGINVPKARAVLGPNVALDTWGLLFDPATAAKLASCGIAVVDNELEAFPPALIWKGGDPKDYSAQANDSVRAIYGAIRPYVRKYGNDDEIIEGLGNGTFCLVLTFSGDVQQAQARAEELAKQKGGDAPEIRYVIPREGAIRWIDTVAIPKNAPHPEAAQRFLDYLMDPAVIAGISNEVAYANANRDATALVDKAITGNAGIYPPADVRAKLSAAGKPDDAQAKARKQMWDLIVYGSL